MQFHLFTLAAIALASSPAPALIVKEARGASAFAAGPPARVFGGLAGDKAACATARPGVPCDSCVATGLTCAKAPLCPCNPARIHDAATVRLRLTEAGGSNVLVVGPDGRIVTQRFADNYGRWVELSWANLCALTPTAPASCEALTGTSVVRLTLVVDLNNDGRPNDNEPAAALEVNLIAPDADAFATYDLLATDGITRFTPAFRKSKIHVDAPVTAPSFPNLAYGSRVTGVRGFVSYRDLPSANPLGADVTSDLKIETSGVAFATTLGARVKNRPSFVRLGMVDEAGNVVRYVPDPAFDTDAATVACATGGVDCAYAARPSF